jgi:hypothetical protein
MADCIMVQLAQQFSEQHKLEFYIRPVFEIMNNGILVITKREQRKFGS